MTTQWNRAHAHGDSGSRAAAEGEGRESDRPEAGDRSDEQRTQQGGRESTDSGPWRGYTVPVPEHSHRQNQSEAAHEHPSYDGITGYPEAGATTQSAPDDGVGVWRTSQQSTGQQPSAVPQRRSGRHARPSAPEEASSSSGSRAPDHGGRSEHDDPEGLAGWVDGLTNAAEDTRIAGRSTDVFPAVPPAESDGEEPPTRRREPPPVAGTATRVPASEQDQDRNPDRGPVQDENRSQGQSPAQDLDAPEDERAHGSGEDGQASPPEDRPSLPRRVPGPSAVSGAFRAVGADTPEPGVDSAVETGPKGSAAQEPSAPAAASVASVPDEDGEYQPTTHDTWQSRPSTSRSELVERLEALSTLLELGQQDLPAEVTARADQLLEHAGARLRLSAEHTVVALAGGTGSGKSSLFNALCGLELSQTGITRPTTSKAHACVWGHEGADDLLSWLGVPPRYRHSRTGVLDANSSELTGLVLLDLPDHDSVRSMHTTEADRLIGSVDLLVWVLDPQKYADAAVHHRYLAKMAGHGAITIAVLNQVDRVEPDELEELLTDLRRLLETESGVHPRVITTSTLTDQGVHDLREFLSGTVRDRNAMVDRLVADLDLVVDHFEDFHGEGEIPVAVPTEVRSRVREGFSNAAGVSAVADVAETNDVKRGKRRVGWPVARRAGRMRKDPLAAVQLDFLRRDSEHGVSGPVDAHEAGLDAVVSGAADAVSEGMPSLWRRRLRAAARSGLPELPAELGEAVSAAVGQPGQGPSWWKFARGVQYALLIIAGLGLAWAAVSALSWSGGGMTGLRMFDDPVSIVYASAIVLAALLVGWLTGVGCGNLVEVAAVQRREQVERGAQARVREIAGVRVIEPMEAELARYRAFREAYEVARPSS